MDNLVKIWACEKLREDIHNLADDPHGYAYPDTTIFDAWNRLDDIADYLGIDALSILVEVASESEIARLNQLMREEINR